MILLPRNPLLARIEDFLHLVKPHFGYHAPYTGCKNWTLGNETQSLRFRRIKDLIAKSKDIDTSTNASWREMLVSQHIIRDRRKLPHRSAVWTTKL
jgi:hypothetical protein